MSYFGNLNFAKFVIIVENMHSNPLFISPGFYCPLGHVAPVPCPKGTYSPTAGADSIDGCLQCPPQHYCPRPSLASPLLCAPEAQQPLSGQDSCVCPGQGQRFQVTVSLCPFLSFNLKLQPEQSGARSWKSAGSRSLTGGSGFALSRLSSGVETSAHQLMKKKDFWPPEQKKRPTIWTARWYTTFSLNLFPFAPAGHRWSVPLHHWLPTFQQWRRVCT